MDQDQQYMKELLDSLAPEDNLGILLAMQMGGTPQEIQLIIQTTEFDEEKEALKITGQYIVRAIGVAEHRASVGFFRSIVLSQQNPLLYSHNEKLMQVYFRGTPENIDSLLIDISQLYGQTYGIYDPNRRMIEELNTTRPLGSLLTGGQGLLGTMPEPFAYKIAKVLERHNMVTNFIEETETHRPEGVSFQLLAMDDTYIIAQLFSVEPIKREASNN